MTLFKITKLTVFGNTQKLILLSMCFCFQWINAQRYPPNNQKLLFIGQDLTSVADYNANCTGCHRGHGEIAYVSFYTLEEATINIGSGRAIYYGGMGMDNSGNRDTNNTDWGAGPLNLWTSAERYSLVTIGLSIVEDQFFGENGLNAIANGDHDSKIVKMATFFNQFPSNVFYLRIGYEFDGNWNQYNQSKYVIAYKHIVDVLNANLSLNNVEYVWQSSTSPVDDILDGGQEDISLYYPGDAYVDWMGLSWFLLADENPTANPPFMPATQLELANELVSFAVSKGKPVMISEAAPQGYQIDSKTNCNISPTYDGAAAQNCVSKTAAELYEEWFDQLFDFIASNDNVRALSYINADWDNQFLWSASNGNYVLGYWGDSRVEEDADVMNSWIASIVDPVNNFLQTEDSSDIFNLLSVDDIVAIDSPNVSIYPNPVSNILNLEGLELSNVSSYQLFSVQGKKVMEGVIDNTSVTIIDVSRLVKGVYLLKMGGSSFVEKLVKQ